MNLSTEADLARLFHIEEPRVAELRRKHGWPHVRLGRFDVRYTESQVEQIVALHTELPVKVESAPGTRIAGQTPRSAARKRAS